MSGVRAICYVGGCNSRPNLALCTTPRERVGGGAVSNGGWAVSGGGGEGGII